MTNAEILSDLYSRLGYNAVPIATVISRCQRFVNQTHRQLLTAPNFQKLRDDTLTFDSVAGQAIYALPQAVAKIEHLSDRASNRHVEERPLSWLRGVDPGLTSAGGPSDVYVPRGHQQVAIQPSASTELFVLSTGAADNTQVVRVEGVKDGGVYKGQATLTGITPVTLGTGWTEVTKFYLSAPVTTSGAALLRMGTSTGTEIARIPGSPSADFTSNSPTYARYLAIQLWPTPGSVRTYHVDYVRTIFEMGNPTDEPLLPIDFHWLLVEGALIKEFSKKDDPRRVHAKKAYDDGVIALRSWVTTNPETIVSLRPVGIGWSSLGSSYPSDMWRT